MIVPESPEHVLVYVDYVAQEIGIAAALSKDPVMRSIFLAPLARVTANTMPRVRIMGGGCLTCAYWTPSECHYSYT